MEEPTLDYVTCASPSGTHRMAYWQWGDPDNDRVLLCVHGLTRTGRDFDELARRLSPHYRVVCPDIVGRGRSDWLVPPASYEIPQYAADMLVLIAKLSPSRLDWVGTSMGGLIGLALAGALAMSAASPARREGLGDTSLGLGRFVLNDIGPRLNFPGLARIGQYVGQPAEFADFLAAVEHVRSVSADFGPHTDEQWASLTRHVFLESEGRWIKHYDPRIAEPFAWQTPAVVSAAEAILWAAYEGLSEPVLLIRGAHSDLLTEHDAREMLARNPRSRLLEIPEAGHAPTLMAEAQIAPVARFLLDD